MLQKECERNGDMDLADAIRRASCLVSDEVGIVKNLWSAEITSNDPLLYRVEAEPAGLEPLTGYNALNVGSGVSHSLPRAVMKAVGECIERYCGAQYNIEDIHYGSFSDGENYVDPTQFALYEAKQYQEPDWPYLRMDHHAQLGWIKGQSLISSRELLVPAALVFVPYRYSESGEKPIWDSISTGLACGLTKEASIYGGLKECVERDAFMITWLNRIAPPKISLESLDEVNAELVGRIRSANYEIKAYLITVDINVPVVLIVCSNSGCPPFTVVGLGTDLNLANALKLALEEVGLGILGMRQAAQYRSGFSTTAPHTDIRTLDDHGLAYALLPEFRSHLAFLDASAKTVEVPENGKTDIAVAYDKLIRELRCQNLEPIAVDVTTPDIREAGFFVTRAVIPTLEPLHNSHATPYWGGVRKYAVATKLGYPSISDSSCFNQLPHPFP